MKPERGSVLLPATVISAVVFGVFIAFVYAYPAIFGTLDAARPEFVQRRVETALASGETGRAVKIAREAAKWRPLDPMAHTMYGRALIADGKPDAGLDSLYDALRVPTTEAPEYRPTHRPYFFAPARLSLADAAFDRGDRFRALEHLLLAKVYADIDSPAFERFDPLLTELSLEFDDAMTARGANWRGILQMPDGSAYTPGWVDVARDWYGIREEAAGIVDSLGARKTLRVTNGDIHKMALFYSVPVGAGAKEHYTLAAWVRAPETPAVVGWQALDAREVIISEGWLFDQETTTDAGESREVAIPPNYLYEEIRAVFGITRHEGTAMFSDVRLDQASP